MIISHRLIHARAPRTRTLLTVALQHPIPRPSRSHPALWLVVLALLLAGCGNAPTSTTARDSATVTQAPPTAMPTPPQHVYFGVQSGASSTVMALNAADGSTVWTSVAFPGYVANVAVDSGTVYALATQGALEALRTSDGKELWHVDESHNNLGSLAVDNGTLFVSDELADAISAYRGSDGSLLWTKAGLGNGGLAFTAVSGVVYAAVGRSAVALQGSTGSILWQKAVVTATNSSLNGGTPTVTAGTVYFPAFGDVYAVNATDGSVRWHYHAAVQAGCPCPLNVSVGSGQVYAPEWDAVVTLSATDGSVVRTTPAHGIALWTDYAGGIVYYRVGGNVYAMQASDGSAVWNVALQPGAPGLAAVGSTAIFLSVNQEGASPQPVPGNLYALRPADGSVLWEFKGTTGGVTFSVLG